MTRSDLIAEVAASNPHLRGADVELIVMTVFDQISEALARGQRVELRGVRKLVADVIADMRANKEPIP